MANDKCLYKDADTGQCYNSTSGRHLEVVSDETCKECCANQSKPTIGDKQRFQTIIKDCIKYIEGNDTKEALRILKKAMEI